MKKRIGITVLGLLMACAVMFSACVGGALMNDRRQLDALNNELDALKSELDALKSENEELKTQNRILQDDAGALNHELAELKQKPELPFNAVLYGGQGEGLILYSELFSEFFGGKDHAFLIKSSTDFDALFTEEKRALYADLCAEYDATHTESAAARGFDTDISYGNTDFSKKILVFCFFTDNVFNRCFELKWVSRERNNKLDIIFGPERLESILSELSALRCLVVELDYDAQYDFDEVNFWVYR